MLPIGPPPLDLPSKSAFVVPDYACDTHAHMLAAPEDFPLWEGRVEDPATGRNYAEWIALYRAHLAQLGIVRGIIVHSIFYGTDNSITIETIRRMGKGFKGVGLVSDTVTDSELDMLVEAGITGVRLNYVHGGVLSWEGAKAIAPRLAERGLHVQMLIHTHKHMEEIATEVAALPIDVCFDHIGWPDLTSGRLEPGFQALLRLLADGNAWIKLSGIYRLCNAPYDASDSHVEALVKANPEHCLWGSDWPHIMLADAKTPDSGVLFDAFARVVTDDATRNRILVSNPENLYKF